MIRLRAALVLLLAGTVSTQGFAASVCDGVSPASGASLTTVLYASGFVRPTLVTAPPADLSRVFVLEQDGRIRIVKDGVLLGASFLDVSALTRSPADAGGNEEGLLGLAFAPDYKTSNRFYVYHTDVTGANNLLVRYTTSAGNPDVADPASRQVLLTFPHPTNSNHNGGMIAFGPDDGLLYIGTGDGGGACDSPGNSQNLSSLLGKLHRIDVSGAGYTIPASNPFVGVPGARGEIWSFGWRNPWRWSFDRLNSDLYVGDVGQGQIEEIDYLPGSSPGGENLGWDIWEGTFCPNPSCGGGGSCTLASYVSPVLDYFHTGGACSVTGGYVYRGCRMPDLSGMYFYADYCAAWIRSFQILRGVPYNERDRTAQLAPGGGLSISFVASFGEDARGEIYIVDASGGEIFKIVPVLPSLEVSGNNAQRLLASPGSWTWENLSLMSAHPIISYQVYRQTDGAGSYKCVFQGPSTTWSGDPQSPDPGSWFSYVVTARNAVGTQTSPGTGTGGIPRVLAPDSCP